MSDGTLPGRPALRVALAPPPAALLRGGGRHAGPGHRLQHRRLQRWWTRCCCGRCRSRSRSGWSCCWQSIPERNAPFVEVSYPYMLNVRAHSRSLAAVAAMPAVNSGFFLGGDGAGARRGTDRHRQLLRRARRAAALPAGRSREAEDKVGAPRVVVLGHGLWQRQFGGDPGAGRTHVEVDGTPMTVVGVMPRGVPLPRRARSSGRRSCPIDPGAWSTTRTSAGP